MIIYLKTVDWMQGSVFQNDDDKKYLIVPGCFKLMNVMVTAFFCFHLGKFAFKRLVKNNRPPEQEIDKDDEVEGIEANRLLGPSPQSYLMNSFCILTVRRPLGL